MQITLRALPGVPNLRGKKAMQVFEGYLEDLAGHEVFRGIHFGLLSRRVRRDRPERTRPLPFGTS